jgi:hypothetical protein
MSLWDNFGDALFAGGRRLSFLISRRFWGISPNMKDPILLIDIICDVYDNPKYLPREDGTTFCNLAAQDICHAYGCNDFDGKDADQIYNFVRNSPNWKVQGMHDVQILANVGTLIFAVIPSVVLRQAHGHICVVRPGKLKDSGKWGLCPSVMNIGAENFIGRAKRGPLTGLPCGVNESFVPIPEFFAYVQSL